MGRYTQQDKIIFRDNKQLFRYSGNSIMAALKLLNSDASILILSFIRETDEMISKIISVKCELDGYTLENEFFYVKQDNYNSEVLKVILRKI